jgi:hypothetical protein
MDNTKPNLESEIAEDNLSKFKVGSFDTAYYIPNFLSIVEEEELIKHVLIDNLLKLFTYRKTDVWCWVWSEMDNGERETVTKLGRISSPKRDGSRTSSELVEGGW